MTGVAGANISFDKLYESNDPFATELKSLLPDHKLVSF